MTTHAAGGQLPDPPGRPAARGVLRPARFWRARQPRTQKLLARPIGPREPAHSYPGVGILPRDLGVEQRHPARNTEETLDGDVEEDGCPWPAVRLPRGAGGPGRGESRDPGHLQPRRPDLGRRRARRRGPSGRRRPERRATSPERRPRRHRRRSRSAPNGRFEGLVTGLALGANVLTRHAPGRSGRDRSRSSTTPTAAPSSPARRSSPGSARTAGAIDDQCNAAGDATATSTCPRSPGSCSPTTRTSPPSDVATTTTDQGKTVPFIVRTETGYQDRDQYEIASSTTRQAAGRPWAPAAAVEPQAADHPRRQLRDRPPDRLAPRASPATPSASRRSAGHQPDDALGRGFAVMSTALDNAGHNCNLVTQAESLVMAKERLVEQYGELRYTIGTGCSGGSLTQQQVANAYPGIYQGILPQCSFPDAWSTGQQLVDYHLIRAYVEDPAKWAPGRGLDPAPDRRRRGPPQPRQLDHLRHRSTGPTSAIPDDGCAGVPTEQSYNADTNPGGVRCTLADYMINVFGPRPERLGPAGAGARPRLRRPAARQRRRPVRPRGACRRA